MGDAGECSKGLKSWRVHITIGDSEECKTKQNDTNQDEARPGQVKQCWMR